MTEPRTIFEVRRWASLFLQENDREVGVGERLIQHHLQKSRVQLLANGSEPIEHQQFMAIQQDIKRHVSDGTPVQHLIGSEQFYGRTFRVNPHVLIPRPETEELIVGILDRVSAKERSFIDLGTGSGVLAITLAKELPDATVFASDLSPEALEVAVQNAHHLQADVSFSEGDFLQPFINNGQKFDVVVSNPPYIPETERDNLSDVVREHDPHMALFAEDNGLAAYKRIVTQLPYVMKDKTLLALEIGHDQGESVPFLIQQHFPKAFVEVVKDINQHNRMVFAWLSS
ncbi:peptide chain release factor N(5)-glutamine methyltransferase [Pontibacillus litoralis]|uniref:Release factor glutamine methyltransferase n=1 Tax=Pontibacillus litoralis JSM 072002 TaxID=1385512 RepID=A0A0A5G329_9BACI|nr:peptide chain release factor N(5)-glutamine methyltransferase [Pontibacillus litoralis]KGX86459.1 hypothetical protein N784_04710 [Pontibacillus litoralis JSM 072002]